MDDMARAAFDTRRSLKDLSNCVFAVLRLVKSSQELGAMTEAKGEEYWKDQVIGQMRGCIGMIELSMEEAEKVALDGLAAANFMCGSQE